MPRETLRLLLPIEERYHGAMPEPGPSSPPPEDDSERHGRTVIQVVNNIFFVIVVIAIALGALAFGLTR